MLRIDIFQPTACYRIPEIGQPILTFPLVPPSTVYGLLRYITGYKPINKDNTKIAISGFYENKFRHIVTNYQETVGSKGQYKSNIVVTEELYNVTHYIHVDSVYEDIIAYSIDKIKRMGRVEDLVTLVNCCKVEVLTKNLSANLSLDEQPAFANQNAKLYVPLITAEQQNKEKLQGFCVFRVPFDSNEALLKRDNYPCLKMFRRQLLLLSVVNYSNIFDELTISKDDKGNLHLLCWLN